MVFSLKKLKLSKVIPIFKSGEVSGISNYKPISLLPSLSNIFEHVILDYLTDYFINNNILRSGQFGFQSGYSTELATLRLVDQMISHIAAGIIPLNICIDISKAFDTLEDLDHTILLEKLWHYGIRDTEHRLIKKYLSNRYQLTEVNGYKSKPLKIKTAVPQGSVVGPLLCLLYINDLPKCSLFFEMVMYVDDTTFYCNIDSGHTSSTVINDELKKISRWLAGNKLSVNVRKTKYIVFHTARKLADYPVLLIDNFTIELIQKISGIANK